MGVHTRAKSIGKLGIRGPRSDVLSWGYEVPRTVKARAGFFSRLCHAF